MTFTYAALTAGDSPMEIAMPFTKGLVGAAIALAASIAVVTPASANPDGPPPEGAPNYVFGPFFGPPGFPDRPDTRYGSQTLILNNGEFVIPAAETGAYYSQNGGSGPPVVAYHFAANKNYLAMSCSSYFCFTNLGPEENANNFFVFDLGKVTGPIRSATLSIGNGPRGAYGFSHYTVYDVTTPIPSLEADMSGPGALAVFTDLGSGIEYGQVGVSPADDGGQIQISLDRQALDSLNSAEGGSWAVGGSVVPEPASWALMLVGFGMLGFAVRRRTAFAAAPAPRPTHCALTSLAG